LEATVAIESKKFPLEGKLKGISDRQLQEHRNLYNGYVNQYNRIVELLEKADSNAANPHFSEWGELKRRESWAHNGALLHQLYFENLGEAGTTKPEKRAIAIINRDFGSIEAFKTELLNAGKVVPVGWVMWAYSTIDQKTHVYSIEQHMNHTPIGILPLLILDVFEHAYMIDYGTARPPYLEAFWENLNWKTVEERIEQLFHPSLTGEIE